MLDCETEVRQFKSKWCYYIHIRANTFGKAMNPFIPSTRCYWLNSKVMVYLYFFSPPCSTSTFAPHHALFLFCSPPCSTSTLLLTMLYLCFCSPPWSISILLPTMLYLYFCSPPCSTSTFAPHHALPLLLLPTMLYLYFCSPPCSTSTLLLTMLYALPLLYLYFCSPPCSTSAFAPHHALPLLLLPTMLYL